MPRESGINLVDVKRRNRSSILNLIFQESGISRKGIATKLGLTPAAITLITTDLIAEGLIEEEYTEQSSNHKGRKEVLLKINGTKYAAVGMYISRQKCRIICTDLDNQVLFKDVVYTSDCHNQSALILEKLCTILQEHMQAYDVLREHKMLGIGISINGIVNTMEGISVNSYNIWEENVPVTAYVSERMQLPVILTNNICSLANGESFCSKIRHPSRTLFIKYGPGIGAARNRSQNSFSIYDIVSVELGHMIMDPNGAACICGNHGCLETIAGYDAIEKSLSALISPKTTPLLHELTNNDPASLTMELVMKSYAANEKPVVTAINRTIFYLALAIQNAIRVIEPELVILYGELFEISDFQTTLINELGKYTETDRVQFSHFNLQLETIGPLSTIVSHFFEMGGFSPAPARFPAHHQAQ